jgi:hypothetical protein
MGIQGGAFIEEMMTWSNSSPGIQTEIAVVRRNSAYQNGAIGIECDFCTVTDNVANFNRWRSRPSWPGTRFRPGDVRQ